MPKTKLKNYLHLHFLVFIWGFTAILGALIHLKAIPLVWYRMFFAVLFVLFYFLIKKKSLKVDKKGLIKFLISGTIIALHWIFFFSAIKVSNVSVALVSMSTGAFFTSLIEPLFFRRRLNPIEFLFGLIIIFGLYIIFNVETQYTLGIIYGLTASFLSALFTVLNGLYIKQYRGAVLSFYQLLFGVLFITFYIFSTSGFTLIDFSITMSDLVYLLILSSICTAYAFIASVNIMKHITPFTVMLTINLEPVYGIILALIIFGNKEKMSPQFYIGGLIILITVLIDGLIRNKKTTIPF
ncbi:DMT family transporter [Lutibacter sp.]|uniref:DMT family transporter n=1 Tax=Lutibacter sp. TaxID=1925666 RepID=UPI0025BBF6A3|nr:DMT family transporter [Lutibacter sp.]MCF6182346.1 DMT family transporter [Lutibacter sp.]